MCYYLLIVLQLCLVCSITLDNTQTPSWRQYLKSSLWKKKGEEIPCIRIVQCRSDWESSGRPEPYSRLLTSSLNCTTVSDLIGITSIILETEFVLQCVDISPFVTVKNPLTLLYIACNISIQRIKVPVQEWNHPGMKEDADSTGPWTCSLCTPPQVKSKLQQLRGSFGLL